MTTLAGCRERIRPQPGGRRLELSSPRRSTATWIWLTTAEPEEAEEGATLGGPLDLGAVLGRRTAELHRALSSGAPDGPFGMARLTRDDMEALAGTARREVSDLLDKLAGRVDQVGETARALAQSLLERRERLMARIDAVKDVAPSGGLCRIHGDYHLGQVLVARTDVMIIDFEGEPTRTLAERTARASPLRDVAGMLRSFDYALWSTVHRRLELGADPERTLAGVDGWRKATRGAFLAAYEAGMAGAEVHPDNPETARALLDLMLIQKAAYEVGYEMAMRPDWIDIPLRGLLSLIEGEPE